MLVDEFDQIFDGGDSGHDDEFAVGGFEEIEQLLIAVPDQKGVVEGIEKFQRQPFDISEIQHHAFKALIRGFEDFTRQGQLQLVAVAMHIAAFAVVIGDAVAAVKFEKPGDLHGVRHLIGLKVFQTKRL